MRTSGPKKKRLRVLILSHSHPSLTRGGAEIAAFQLFASLLDTTLIDVWFLGCDSSGKLSRDGVALTQPFTNREYIYDVGKHFNWFSFNNSDLRLASEFKWLLIQLNPDVIHFHHYANFGVEAIHVARQTLPSVKVVITLHEFLAICNHYGQMVKRKTFDLCQKASPVDCNECFEDIGGSDFFLRRNYILGAFELVDHFICPSLFLKSRYVEWGLDEKKLSVIENILAISPVNDIKAENDIFQEEVLRVGFFGQISKLKGIDVFIESAAQLFSEVGSNIVFRIHGDYRNQPLEFQQSFTEARKKATENIDFVGPYQQKDVDLLMSRVDVVVVPSIWWENSPVVIQEAFRNRRPVVCSNIGGMAEKVRDKIDGFHFSVGDARSLSQILRQLFDNKDLLRNILKTQRRPEPLSVLLSRHIDVYGK